jgi:signal transduction histidine kinase
VTHEVIRKSASYDEPLMQDVLTGDVRGMPMPARAGRLRRMAGRLASGLDILPRSPALGPVPFTPALVGFVGAVICGGAAVAVLTVRWPADSATLAVGGIVAFGEAVYAVRMLGGVQVIWTPSIFVQLGLAVTLGPVGALVGAVGEATGVAIRTRNGWFRSGFNLANHFLSNVAAWWVFTAVADGVQHSAALQLVAGLCAGLVHFLLNNGLLAVVVSLTDPHTSLRHVLRNPRYVYSLGYGLAAFAFVVMHQQAGLLGFGALLVPVLLLHYFVILFARRVHAYEEQRAAFQREREELLHKAVEASETERRRIARDLHDGVVQNLAGSAFALAAKAAELKGNGQQTDPEILELMEQSAEDTRAAMKDLRTLIIELAPPTLRREGLHAALVEILSTLKRKGTDATLDLPPNLRLREDRAALIFRVAQEILRNVAAHAQARHVTVELKRDGGMAVLRIADDGKGFTPRQVQRRRLQGHLGTAAIAELAEEADGSLEIDTEPGKGTRVTLRVPVE